MSFNRKFWGLAIVAAVTAVVISLVGTIFGWRSLVLLFDRHTLIHLFSPSNNLENSASGIVLNSSLFMAAHVVANAIGIPGTLLVVVGGAVYGLWWGTLLSVVGATLGATVAFWLARYLLHSWFQTRFSHRPILKRLNQTLCKQGLSCVLLIRFSPVSPFNVVNFALGLTPVSARSYALGTLIGIIPGTMAYTWLGVTGAEALHGGSLWPLVSCLIVLMLLAGVPIWIQRRSTRH